MKQSTAQHTPGPWKTYNSSNGRIFQHWSVCNRDGSRIAKIEQMPGQGSAEEHANASLISAAPDMLEALQVAAELIQIARERFPKSIKNSDRYKLELTCATINAAINKATQP